MNGETITILLAILGTGLALWRLIAHDLRDIRADVGSLRTDVANLRERMARLEGLIDGFMKRETASAD